MNDPEKPLRDTICKALAAAGRCEQHVRVRRRDGSTGEVDVLVTPHDPAISGYPFAIEAKVWSVVGDDNLKQWFRQAYRYVGAHRIDAPASPVIAASFLWLASLLDDLEIVPTWKEGERDRINGILMAADAFQVGYAWRDQRNRLELKFYGGAGNVWREDRGWTTVQNRAVNLLRRPPP